MTLQRWCRKTKLNPWHKMGQRKLDFFVCCYACLLQMDDSCWWVKVGPKGVPGEVTSFLNAWPSTIRLPRTHVESHYPWVLVCLLHKGNHRINTLSHSYFFCRQKIFFDKLLFYSLPQNIRGFFLPAFKCQKVESCSLLEKGRKNL